jgi:hypothetical protein
VLTVLDGDRTSGKRRGSGASAGYALASDKVGGDLEAFITRCAGRPAAGNGLDLASLQAQAAAGPVSRRAARADRVAGGDHPRNPIRTHNLIGKLPGKRPELGAVLLLAHWDHFGRCAAPPAEDLRYATVRSTTRAGLRFDRSGAAAGEGPAA